MRCEAIFKNYQVTGRDKISICFEVDRENLKELDNIKDDLLILDVDKFRKKKSKDANAYFWKLADLIAKKIKSDKWSIYIWLLSKYGVFVDVAVIPEAVEDMRAKLKKDFRYIEIIDEGEMSTVRCYYGIHTYNTKEMSDLITGTISEAKEIGVETLTPRELEQMMNSWKG